ncbi:CsxC family protein [Clostridium weizhouense]|uniref:CsxC family protein n=1 Tax=Clostridium weizhouense TaxID=2859781 RepID=UPI00358DA9C3
MNTNKGLNVENTNDCGTLQQETCATVATQIEPLTEQTAVTPAIIPAGPVFLKLPVVLAETNITIPVEATITLDQAAIEIKRIKKNVFLTQSRLIPFSSTDATPNTGILFIAGFIRKNIEYATQTCTATDSPNLCGDIRHCTVEVPFNFTTRITFIRPPVLAENTIPSELEYFTDTLRGCDICADPVIGRNPCDQSFSFTEVFNEKPFTELVNAFVTEVDIHTNPTTNCNLPTEQSFTTLTEKLVVNLTLKVLQQQQVRVAAIGL